MVIGGAAVDITGTPESMPRMRDSNIGTVRIHAGGVSMNIARHLAAAGAQVEFVTSTGRGYHGELIRSECRQYGIGMSHLEVSDEHTGVYLSMLDEEGDLLVGLSDMNIFRRITPQYIERLLPELNRCDAVSVDGNLEPETLSFILAHAEVPVFYDPVSISKARRIGTDLSGLYACKPNQYEAGELAGVSADTERGVYRAAEILLSRGVRRVFISMGSDGVCWADRDGLGVLPSVSSEIVDTTGAGDAMSAAIILGCADGLSAEECARLGNEAAAAACRIRLPD